MFDIGFQEMLVCAVVALVVIGPEKLPRVARTLGHLFGRLQRYVTQVKADINREMDAADLGKVKTDFENAARSFQSEVESQARDVEREAREMEASVNRNLEEPALPDATPPGATAEPSPQLELGIEDPAAWPKTPPRPSSPT